MTTSNEPSEPKAVMTKRDFLKIAGVVLAHASFGGIALSARAAARDRTMSHDAIIRMSLIEGLEALKSRRIASSEYCSAALAQAARFKKYNIFTQISSVYANSASMAVDTRRKAGKPVGALQGVPYALKDSIDMAAFYTIAGHPELQYFEPSVDADLVKSAREADAICIGKTQLAPLSLWWTTENSMTGDTGNPFNIAYKTGGSSGGSGAAVAARIVPFSIAEDSAGSLRVPAVMNGVLGFRPSTGRWPTAGTMPMGFSDTLGPIARSVADIKMLDSFFAEDHPKNRPPSVNARELRIGYQKDSFFDDLHSWVQENIERTMSTLSRAGVTLVELKGLPAGESYKVAAGILLSDFPESVARYFNRHRVWNMSAFGLMHHLQSDALKKMLLPAMENAATGEAYFALVGMLMEMRKVYNQVMRDNMIDVLLYPTTKVPNTPNDGGESIVSKGPSDKNLSEMQLGANMLFAPAQKTPSIAMYAGMDKAGLPLSVTFDGYSGQDRRLLDIAEAIEKLLPPLAEPKSI